MGGVADGPPLAAAHRAGQSPFVGRRTEPEALSPLNPLAAAQGRHRLQGLQGPLRCPLYRTPGPAFADFVVGVEVVFGDGSGLKFFGGWVLSCFGLGLQIVFGV